MTPLHPIFELARRIRPSLHAFMQVYIGKRIQREFACLSNIYTRRIRISYPYPLTSFDLKNHIMHFPISLSLVAVLLATLALAAPLQLATLDLKTAMGSKHNIYLTTCTPKCLLGIICSRQERSYTSVLYYANGPVDTLPNASPTYMTTISSNPPRWEGASHSANLGSYGLFSSSIDASAKTIAKGEIAGTVKLEDEQFVCFKDEETSFRFSENLGLSSYTCTANYWCPSIQV